MCSRLLTKWRLLLPFSGGHQKPNYDHSVRSALFHVHGTVSLQLLHEMASMSFELFSFQVVAAALLWTAKLCPEARTECCTLRRVYGSLSAEQACNLLANDRLYNKQPLGYMGPSKVGSILS